MIGNEAKVDSACFKRIQKFTKFFSDVKNKTSVNEISEMTLTVPSATSSETETTVSLNLEEKPKVQNIVINAAEFDVNLMSDSKYIAQFIMAESCFALVLRQSSTTIKLSVGKVELIDPNAKIEKFKKVISVSDDSSTFFDMSIDLMNVNQEIDGNDPFTYDGVVKVRSGSIHYIFFYKFMERLAFAYPDEFGTESDPVLPNLIPEILVTQPSRATRKSKDKSHYCSRYKLDVEIKNPTLFIPVSDTNSNGLLAEIATLRVSNKFEVIEKVSINWNFNPIIDQMHIECNSLCLYRVIKNSENRKVLHEDFHIDVDRSLGSDFYFDIPEMTVNIGIDAFTISMSKRDLELFWCVLYGNIMDKLETKAPLEAGRRKGTMAWSEEPSKTNKFPEGRPDNFCEDKKYFVYKNYTYTC